MAARASSSAAAPRAQIETSAPAAAKFSAMARPMPRLPPATTTRRPEKSTYFPQSARRGGGRRRAL
jgi:hypothetical protein